jgi:hypothetical protein
MVLAFLLVIILVLCFHKYNERRILIGALFCNAIALVILADYNHNNKESSAKYLAGFTFGLLTNIMIETATVTFIMKNLSHFIPSTN